MHVIRCKCYRYALFTTGGSICDVSMAGQVLTTFYDGIAIRVNITVKFVLRRSTQLYTIRRIINRYGSGISPRNLHLKRDFSVGYHCMGTASRDNRNILDRASTVGDALHHNRAVLIYLQRYTIHSNGIRNIQRSFGIPQFNRLAFLQHLGNQFCFASHG